MGDGEQLVEGVDAGDGVMLLVDEGESLAVPEPVPVGDAEGLAQGVRRVLANPNAGDACRDRFERHLSFDALSAQLCAVYEDLLNEAPRRQP